MAHRTKLPEGMDGRDAARALYGNEIPIQRRAPQPPTPPDVRTARSQAEVKSGGGPPHGAPDRG